MSKESNELPEDIEVIGPGQMLAEARQKLNLSQQDVATKLNFRVTLVDEIEQDYFDKSLPDTFNRGYLKNYAKLVGVAESDILSSYEMLGVAAKQRTEMQSFSKITEKQAQHSRLMWVSYLILAALVASTVVFYLQNSKNEQTAPAIQTETSETQSTDAEIAVELSTTEREPTASAQLPDNAINTEGGTELASQPALEASQEVETASADESNSVADAAMIQLPQTVNEEPQESVAIFTFAGDCWVNIKDANGERIAYGIKKTGYVMELRGETPFEVVVGKPELVQIDFNGQSIDMSKYNVGNIAKFTLPESS